MKPQLNDNHIRFDEEAHRYFNESGKELQGITSTIIKYFFPDTYANVSEETLTRAAEHGHYVHNCIEMSDVVGATEGCPESQQFLDMMAEHRMTVVAHEYIVTCFDKFASPIDVVMQDEDGGIWLGDIKTTSALLEPKVRLQLSLYAMMFELNNPHLKVKGVVEIWLPKERYRTSSYNGWQVLPRTSYKDTEEAICAYLNHFDPSIFLPRFTGTDVQLPANVQSIIFAIAEQERMAKEIKVRTDEMKATLLAAFEEYDIKKFETADVTITKVAPATRKSVDSKKLKDDYPDVYFECLKESKTSASIKITLK